MALPFRLSYNEGTEYVDLFPRTLLKNIEGTDNLLKYSTVEIEVPASENNNIIIPHNFTDKQTVAPFYVVLLTTSNKAKSDYSQINQIQVNKENLSILKLYNTSNSAYKIRLTFKERGV